MQQSRVEFFGGPKDGELLYSRSAFLSDRWFRPVLGSDEPRLPSEDEEYYVYGLEQTEVFNEYKYIYQGIIAKDKL